MNFQSILFILFHIIFIIQQMIITSRDKNQIEKLVTRQILSSSRHNLSVSNEHRNITIRRVERERGADSITRGLTRRLREGQREAFRGGMGSLIDDEGAKRKVRGLIANIGNYGTRGDRGHLPSLARGAFILSQWDSTGLAPCRPCRALRLASVSRCR